jgi:asparagine synthase (glutamine-hydrolysing)
MLLDHIEEPFRSLSVYSQYRSYEMVRRDTGVTVLLNGQGGDELFGGYTRHYYVHFASLIRRGLLARAVSEARTFSATRGVPLEEVWRRTKSHVRASIRRPDYFTVTSWRELSHSALREYLKYDDRNSSAFGLEARVPFLDYRIVEFAFSMSEDLKIDAGSNKRIEREVARNSVPEGIVARTDKMGFVSPQEVWQREQMRPWLIGESEPLRSSSVLARLPERDTLLSRYDDYLAGRSGDWAFAWRMFCFSRWLTAFGTAG